MSTFEFCAITEKGLEDVRAQANIALSQHHVVRILPYCYMHKNGVSWLCIASKSPKGFVLSRFYRKYSPAEVVGANNAVHLWHDGTGILAFS
jgi:hypothetical protein